MLRAKGVSSVRKKWSWAHHTRSRSNSWRTCPPPEAARQMRSRALAAPPATLDAALSAPELADRSPCPIAHAKHSQPIGPYQHWAVSGNKVHPMGCRWEGRREAVLSLASKLGVRRGHVMGLGSNNLPRRRSALTLAGCVSRGACRLPHLGGDAPKEPSGQVVA